MVEIVEITEFSNDCFEIVRKFLDVLVPGRTERFSEVLLKELLASDCSHLFFALEEEKIMGMLTLGIYISPTGKKSWIEDVVVDESCRGKGIGKLLVEYAIRYAKAQGSQSLMLTSNPSRIAANELYKSLGFEKKETNVYRMTFCQ